MYASYGMTETSSQVANMLITPQFTGGMRLLPGYSARIVEPDAEGFGRLALRGPGDVSYTHLDVYKRQLQWFRFPVGI